MTNSIPTVHTCDSARAGGRRCSLGRVPFCCLHFGGADYCSREHDDDVGAYRRTADGGLTCVRDLRRAVAPSFRPTDRPGEWDAWQGLMRNPKAPDTELAGLGSGPDLLASRMVVMARTPRQTPPLLRARRYAYLANGDRRDYVLAMRRCGRYHRGGIVTGAGKPARAPRKARTSAGALAGGPRFAGPVRLSPDWQADERRAAERRTAGTMAWLADTSA